MEPQHTLHAMEAPSQAAYPCGAKHHAGGCADIATCRVIRPQCSGVQDDFFWGGGGICDTFRGVTHGAVIEPPSSRAEHWEWQQLFGREEYNWCQYVAWLSVARRVECVTGMQGLADVGWVWAQESPLSMQCLEACPGCHFVGRSASARASCGNFCA
eukprot:216724-Chlamydomonas_euryale.AAC.4